MQKPIKNFISNLPRVTMGALPVFQRDRSEI
jgi:hypothetical protein